jgi:hypothetical protein
VFDAGVSVAGASVASGAGTSTGGGVGTLTSGDSDGAGTLLTAPGAGSGVAAEPGGAASGCCAAAGWIAVAKSAKTVTRRSAPPAGGLPGRVLTFVRLSKIGDSTLTLPVRPVNKTYGWGERGR